MPTIDDLIKNGVNTYSYYQPAEKPPEDGNFVRGFKRAMYQIPETLGGTAALVGDVAGADGLRDYGMSVYEKNHAKGEELTKPSDSLTSVLQGEDGANVGDFLTGSAGYVAGQAATALATGGAGGFIGSQLAKRGIKSLAEKGVESVAAKMAAEKAAATGAKYGAGTALFGSNLSQEAGSIYPEALEQAKKEGRTLDAGDKARVVASALAAAGVETAMDASMLHKVFGGGRKVITDPVTGQLVNESMAKAVLREVPGSMAKEASTEGIQTGIERYGAGQDLTTAEAIRDYVDSMGVGAVGGGLGGGASVLHAQKVQESGPLTRAANTSIDEKILQLAHDPQPLISFPDGSVGHKQDMAAYLTQFTDPEERQAKERELMGRDPKTGKRIEPEPAPEPTVADSEEKSKANIKALSDKRDPVTLDYAQNLLKTPAAKGLDLMITPHSSGNGYVVVPSKWLTLHGQTKAMELQKPGPKDAEKSAKAAPSKDSTLVPNDTAKQLDGGENASGNPDKTGNAAGNVGNEGGQQVGNQEANQGINDAGRNGSIPGQADADGNGNGNVDNALILNPQGKPFVTEFAAKRKLKTEKLGDTHDVVKVPDGYVVQRKPAPANDEFDQAAHEAATSELNDKPQPTEAQKAAGNYQKGHVKLHGLDISIENPVGSTRSGVDTNGKPWSNTMQNHYGYIKRSEGADGDHVDTFIGNNRESDRVFIVNQTDPDTGNFDETKVMLGFDSLKEAKAAYKANYAKNWKGGKDVRETSVEGFKAWLKDGDTKKPFKAVLKSAENQPEAAQDKDSGVVPKPAETGTTATNTASWVIREKDTGKVIMETFDRKKVDALNTAKYEAVPIRDHLAGLNADNKPQVERRKDSATRKKISDMTPDEMRVALLTDDMTQLGNRRAYEESDKKPFQASIDIDSLKWVNDNMGHASGDQLIRLIGRALKEQTQDAYHLSGDEFVAQFDDEAAGAKLLESVRDRLRGAVIEITRPDGTVVTKTGLEFSYGIAPTLNEADTKLAADKIAREASGQRAGRGEQPAGVTERPAEGKQDNQGDAAAEEIEKGEHSRMGQGVFDLSLVPDGNKIRDFKVGDTSIILDARPDMVKISSVRTPQAKRGQGAARAAMQALINQADAEGVTLSLAASALDKKTSTAKLVNFYESLGFQLTGRTINALGEPEMIRQPKQGDAAADQAVEARHAAIEKILYSLDNAQVAKVAEKLGIKSRPNMDLRERINEEHPDDSENAIAGIAKQNKTSEAAPAASAQRRNAETPDAGNVEAAQEPEKSAITPDVKTAPEPAAKPKSKALQERDAKIAERSGKTSRLTPMAHEKLSDASTRADLETMAEESGWEQVGGKMLREIANDPNSRVIGRTPWIPKHEWYAAMPERLNEAQTQDAVKKALSGEPMTAKEKRVVGYMIDMAEARNKEMTDYQAEHADDNDAQEAESALGALSDDQFDAIFEAGSTDPEEIMRALGFTEEEIANELPKAAGTESGQGTGETAAGTASESGQRSGAEAGPDGFALESETADQARTRIAAEERRQAEEKAAAKADDDKAKADAQVGGFTLTGSDRAADANPGQGDIFSQPETERFEAGKALTKDQRKATIKTLTDVYSAKGHQKEERTDSRGEPYMAYPHAPDLFEKSDITGSMVRYYVTLPDGRIAHPSELFPDYTQSDIDTEISRQKTVGKAVKDAVSRLLTPDQVFDSSIAAAKFWDAKSDASTHTVSGKPTIFGSLERTIMSNGDKFIMIAPGELKNEGVTEEFAARGWNSWVPTKPKALQERDAKIAAQESKPPAKRAARKEARPSADDEMLPNVGAAGKTDSAAFKKWFGDSKVVDADGKPLPVFHGTPTGGFADFSEEKKGTRTGHSADDVGFHFTDSASYAEAYSGGYNIDAIETYRKAFGDEPTGIKMPPGASTYPVYLNISNPLRVGKSKQINAALIQQAKATGHDGIIADMGGAKEYVAFRPEQIKSATGNNGNFDPDNPSILGAAGDQSSVSDFDKSLYADIGAGKSSTDLLRSIAKESTNPMHRELAQALMDAGVKSAIEHGDADGKNFKVKNLPAGVTYTAAYDPKTDTVFMFQPHQTEVDILHELVHAATSKAVRANGIMATQMKALYHHVNRSGEMKGMYGMENHDEFVAEALSSNEFQDKLRGITAMPEGSKFANAWNWFTDLVRRAIGLPTKYASALDQALRFGRGMMDENKAVDVDDSGMLAAVNSAANNEPSTEFKQAVIDRTYDGKGFDKAPDGSKYLAAIQRKTNRGIFVVDGKFDRETYKKIIAEQRAAGLDEKKIYVFADTATYTGHGIEFMKLEDLAGGRPTDGGMMAAAGSQRDAMRFVDQWETDDGKPIYYGKDWLLQPEKELDASADLQPNGLPMGQVAFVDEGNKVLTYTIRDNAGKVLGTALMQINPRGDIVAIHDIETKIKSRGLGKEVVGAVVASTKTPIRIIQMIPSAAKFWEGLGVYGHDTYDNGALDWSAFSQSDRGRAAGVAAKGVQGRGAGTAAGSESQSAEAGKAGLNDDLLANVGRAADTFLGKLGVQQDIRNNVSDLFQSEKTFNGWWHKTVGTQYHKAQIDHHFKRVYDATQRYLSTVSAFANEAADFAPTLLPKLDGLRDLAKKPPSKVDTEAAGRAIFEGTLNDHKVYTDDELRAQYKLTQPQIDLYREFRAAADKSLDDMGKTDILRYAGDDGAHLVNAVLAAKDVAAGAKILTEHLNAIKEEDAAKVIQAKADRIEQLKTEGYAPLMRFGEHTVYVTDKNGNQLFFGMAETGREAAKLARDMKETYPDATVTQGVLSTEGAKLFAGISPDTIEVFAQTTGLDKNPLFQDYLKLVINNRSALKRLIERKGIAGFSQDTTRVLASFLTSNARASSKNLHGGEMSKAANDIPKEKGDVRDEAIRLVDYIQNPVEEAAKLRGLLFTNFIGGSIASAAVNMTQPVMMTLPYLAQFGGAVKATKTLAGAMKMAAMGENSIQDKELRDAMHKAEREGIVSPQEIHNLQAEAMRSSKGITIGGKEIVPAFAARKMALVWGGFFGLAEQFNRRATFIAAYQMAKDMTPAQFEKAGVANAYEFAAKSIAETQGTYNRGNRPDWARGALGATLMTFKQYSVSYLEFLKRLPPKERALALGILVVAAGANGLPFADDLDDVIDTIGQALGYNFNSKKAKQRFVTNIMGENAANFVLHGFSGVGGLPLDVSMRMGMGNLLPGTGLLMKSETDKSQQMAEFFGAAGGYGQKVLKAGDKLLSGDPAGALMAMSATAVSNAVKAVDMMQNDAYRDSRGRKVMDTDMVDAIVKGIGFQPSNVAKEQEKLSSVRQDIAMANAIKTEIADKWAQGVFEKDTQAAAKAREAINTWNRKNPDSQINVTMDQIAKRVRAMRTEKQDRMIKSAPKSMRTAVREELK